MSEQPIALPPTPAAEPVTVSPPPAPYVPAVERRPGLLGGLEALTAVAVVALAFLVSSFAARNSDAWMDLAAGRLIASGEYSFGSDPFSFSGADRTWVNHSWLYDLGLYALYSAGGGRAVVVAKALLVALLAGLILAMRRAGEPLWLWAVLTALAVLAMAPRLLLQPVVVSLVLLAATLLLLRRAPARGGSWALPVVLAVLFALWANLDRWFFLGPLAVALYLAGEGLRRALAGAETGPAEAAAPAGAAAGAPPSLWVLGAALGAGLVATLLNPHLWRVWELPPELVSARFAADLQGDAAYRALFLSPALDPASFFGPAYSTNPVNPGAYFALLALGLVALAANYRAAAWGWAGVWAGFALLSLAHARAVPFFAVVGVPAAAMNLAALGAGWRAAAARHPPGEPQAGGRPLLDLGEVTARLAACAAVLVLLALAWPGWLNTYADTPARACRVNWEIDADPSLRRTAEQLQRWREEGLLPEGVRGFGNSAPLAHYCAWFAPAEKTFFDNRFAFHAPEAGTFSRLTRLLRDRARGADPATRDDIARLFREYQFGYLVLHHGSDQNQLTELWPDPQWTPWYMDGRTAVLGWRETLDGDPGGYNARLAFDPVRRAFGDQPEPLPVPERFFPEPRTLLDRYLYPPPETPLEAYEAEVLLRYARYRQALGQQHARFVNFARTVLQGAAPLLSAPVALAPTPPRQDAAQAVGLLAVRACRRAAAAAPDDPVAYFHLSQAYDLFMPAEDLRGLQTLTALRRARDRQPPPEVASAGECLLGTDTAFALSRLHAARGQYDLALAQLRQAIAYLERYLQLPPDPRADPGRVREMLTGLRDLRWPGIELPPEEFLREASDRYENRAKLAPTVIQRVRIARDFGLWEEAMNLCRSALQPDAAEMNPDIQSLVVVNLIEMELQCGMAEQVASDLTQLFGNAPDGGTDRLLPDLREQFLSQRWRVALALGDYPAAGEVFGRWARLLTLDAQTRAKMAARTLAAMGMPWLGNQPVLALFTSDLLGAAVGEGDRRLRRALIALEEGDLEAARLHLRQAVRPYDMDVTYASGSLAAHFLRLMDRAAGREQE